jgi:hypothetical protein
MKKTIPKFVDIFLNLLVCEADSVKGCSSRKGDFGEPLM